jgi:hypothetical protein
MPHFQEHIRVTAEVSSASARMRRVVRGPRWQKSKRERERPSHEPAVQWVEAQMQIQVALENGEMAACQVIKRTGFNHDIGARTCLVEYDGKQFVAVVQRGAWRKWTAV